MVPRLTVRSLSTFGRCHVVYADTPIWFRFGRCVMSALSEVGASRAAPLIFNPRSYRPAARIDFVLYALVRIGRPRPTIADNPIATKHTWLGAGSPADPALYSCALVISVRNLPDAACTVGEATPRSCTFRGSLCCLHGCGVDVGSAPRVLAHVSRGHRRRCTLLQFQTRVILGGVDWSRPP